MMVSSVVDVVSDESRRACDAKHQRGQLAPLDHGIAPVVLSMVMLTICLSSEMRVLFCSRSLGVRAVRRIKITISSLLVSGVGVGVLRVLWSMIPDVRLSRCPCVVVSCPSIRVMQRGVIGVSMSGMHS